MRTNSNIGGHKHCRCKKSECLKLYCECFASELYCVEACSCQGCFNTLDYEDTVEEARRKIVQRNPVAFSPKIDFLIEPQRTNRVDGGQLIPIAGKHKKGCNCRKSMCRQKYCECYQANVGCTDACRCEECKNTYGNREYNVHNESSCMRSVHSKLNNPDKNEMESIWFEFSSREFHNPQNSTPWTPIQHSEPGSNTPTGRYIPSSGTVNSGMTFDTSGESSDMVPSACQRLYPNVEYMNQVTPQTDINTRNLTSLVSFPLMERQQSSQVIWNFSSVGSVHYHATPISTPESLVGGPKPYNSTEKPTEAVHNNTPNIQSDSSIHLSTDSITSARVE